MKDWIMFILLLPIILIGFTFGLIYAGLSTGYIIAKDFCE
jgi:hypothetical protein